MVFMVFIYFFINQALECWQKIYSTLKRLWFIVYLGPDSQGTTLASKFAIVSFLCVLDAV